MKKSLSRITIVQKLLHKGLILFYTKGFYNTSVETIIESLELSNRAFYTYFDSKEDFFEQIIENVLTPTLYSEYIDTSLEKENPLTHLIQKFEIALDKSSKKELEYGAMLAAFLEEFHDKNEVIYRQLNALVRLWELHLVSALQEGQSQGYIDRKVDCEGVAAYTMSTYFGIRTIMLGTGSNLVKEKYMTQVKAYYLSLQPKTFYSLN